MKTLLILLFFATSSTTCAEAQKINLEKWVSHTVDSLRNKKVDTIEYYHAYCGECLIMEKPRLKTDTLPKHVCDVGNGWVQIKNLIIYKQKGKYFSLTFNCDYPPIKTEIKSVKSVDYFISIIPVLTKRDILKKHKFYPLMSIDGGYEEAILYISHIKRNVYMKEDQKTDKVWRSFFWIDKQTKILALLESETGSTR